MLNGLLCKATSHSINRRHVWHDGIDYRTRCRRCGAELLRDEAGWRPYDSERDRNPEREAHPKERQAI